ncbi:ABC transporter permease [Paraconexibacter antarcticus]|uniref:ABC transporter permease n=1 Tax=Paraconexibacter antarcticus TaxID=2949664 RepID=A0ABY5DZ24_9ACTN|nr:ABC transporter permease [Paraconexibacter antarcticus]UTI65814.1 ABC transporter permease [Paraconexibacter antarcticus]
MSARAASAACAAPAATAGWAGILAGVLALFVALPPLTVRSDALVVVLGALALAAGAAALRGGERKLGGAAILAGLLGAGLGYGAAHTATGGLEAAVSWGALGGATLRFACPLIFAALGGLVSERSGVVNIALEGMMLMGAFFAAYGADKTGSWVLGILIGMLAGAALAAVHAVFAISVRSDQIVSGTALNFVALGLTGYMYVDVYGADGTPNDLPQVPEVHLPTSSLGFAGNSIDDQNLLVWVSLVMVVAVWVFVFRTRAGLRMRSVGENPRAAETVGISVQRTRYLAVIASGALAALGGAFLSIGSVHSFTQNMTAGKGFIALAALIFGRWRPFGLLAATLLFGFSSALAQRLPQLTPGAENVATLLQALPYVLTLVAVAGVIGRSIPPKADGVPYKREG